MMNGERPTTKDSHILKGTNLPLAKCINSRKEAIH